MSGTTTTLCIGAMMAAAPWLVPEPQSEFVWDLVERWVGLAAFVALVFWLGKRIIASTDTMAARVGEMEKRAGTMEAAIESNTVAHNSVAQAIQKFAETQLSSNSATLASQTVLADRNLAEQMRVFTRVEETLARIAERITKLEAANRRPRQPAARRSRSGNGRVTRARP